MKKAILILLFATPGYAQLLPEAPWSQSEFDSLVAATDGCIDTAAAWRSSLQAWKSDGFGVDVNRVAVANGSHDFAEAAFFCHEALFKLYNAPRGSGPVFTREELVSQSKSNIATAVSRLQDGIVTLPVNTAFSAAVSIAEDAIDSLQAFDQSLGYLSWQPSYYPTLVGFHGDYDYSFKRLRHASRYTAHALSNTSRMLLPEVTPVFTEYARTELSTAANQLWGAMAATFRAASLEALVFVSDDWDRLMADVTAARLQGRGPEFFKSVLALEYINSQPGPVEPPKFSGASNVPYSAAGRLGGFFLSFQRIYSNAGGLVEANTAEWGRDQLLRLGPITFGNTLSPYSENAADIIDLWPGLDNYNWGVMGFFHGITTPPTPPPDPGPDCPNFVPEMMLTSPTTAEARCVEVP